MEEELKIITSKLLPSGCDFSEQQKNVILLEGNANIVAGPGSGKTTVLIAKCALLFKKNINSKNGICLITHTNVAVDEIMNGLKKIGIGNIEYPNFVGTIQDFIITFFTKKAFNLLVGEKDFDILDDDEYQMQFSKTFEQLKPNWYKKNAPKVRKRKPRLIINDDLTYYITSEVKESYQDKFNESIRKLFNCGYITNHQCLELANWYIDKYLEQLKSAFQKRFTYVLLDEAQDTSQLQYEILNKLFANSDISFQKFGDPYQALYNIFDDNDDAWVPSREIDIPYKEISETSRFGKNIADIVKTVCIEKYDTFKSQNLIDSFKPYYLIYKNEDDLLEQYKGLIKYCSRKSVSFSSSNKKDAILATFHEDLTNLFSTYRKPTTKISKDESLVKKCINFLFTILTKETGLTYNELKEKVKSHLNCKVIMSKCIKSIKNGNVSDEAVNNHLEKILEILTNNEKTTFTEVHINSEIERFLKTLSNTDVSQSLEEKDEFYIGTIHSAKGETHRSTLLVLNTVFKNYDSGVKYTMFELLIEYLAGNHINPKTIQNKNKKNETIKALKLAYVALSRPTHLIAIAIPEEMISDENDIIDKLNKNGWIMYRQSVTVSTK